MKLAITLILATLSLAAQSVPPGGSPPPRCIGSRTANCVPWADAAGNVAVGATLLVGAPPVTGLLARYTADAQPGSDGDLVASVVDQSGNGHTATATGALRPTLKKAIHAGHSAFRFSREAANGLVLPASLSVARTSFSVYFVSRVNHATFGVWSVFGTSDNAYQMQKDAAQMQMALFHASTTTTAPKLTMPTGVRLHGVSVSASEVVFRIGQKFSRSAVSTAAATVTGGTIGYFSGIGYNVSADVFDALVFDHALTDAEYAKLLSWAQGYQLAGQGYGMTVICYGNSLTAGYNSNGLSYPQQIANRLSNRPQVINLGQDSLTTPDLITYAPTALVPLISPHVRSVCILLEGRNHIVVGGADAAAAYASLVTLGTAVKAAGCYTVMLTVLKSGSLNDATRTTLNSSIKGGAVSDGAADLVIDIAGDTRLNAWASDVTSDGVHLTEYGNQVVAEIIAAALNL